MNWSDYFEYDGENLIKKPNGNKGHDSLYAGKVCGGKVYMHGLTYIVVRLFDKRYKAHRVIWEMVHGEIPEGMSIDHIDGDGLNNKKDNLRLVYASENNKNKKISVNNKSGFHGIHWDKRVGKWRARISVCGFRKNLGLFESLDQAVRARRVAEPAYDYHPNHGRKTDRV